MIANEMDHPLAGISFRLRGFKSFVSGLVSVNDVSPITLLIGRNNTGKSSIIDFIEIAGDLKDRFQPTVHANDVSFELTIVEEIGEEPLKRVFREDTRGGFLPGNHWQFGSRLIGKQIVRTFKDSGELGSLSCEYLEEIDPRGRREYEMLLSQAMGYPFKGITVLRVSAERAVSQEVRELASPVSASGRGTTNLIRAFINHEDLPRKVVDEDLLNDLNRIYSGDCKFSRISCQENDAGVWEIYLHEDGKGDIRLSQSGSSLQSIFQIIAMLRLNPKVEPINWRKTLVAIEEPENNLHPSLLRQLLSYLSDMRDELEFGLVLSTHSPVCIDWAAPRFDSQVVHVRREGGTSKASASIGYFSNREIIDDLDIRASDILQANGIIWVEGPTDRILIRRWLELASGGSLVEGIHYGIMFYGGKLLSHLDAVSPQESSELIHLLSINANVAVVIDSDRREIGAGRTPPRRLSGTKRRIINEVDGAGGFSWVTAGKEIENYIPRRIIELLAGQPLPEISSFESIIDLPQLAEFKNDKVQLSRRAAELFDCADMDASLDLRKQIDSLIEAVKRWNRM